jgi:hypothetical protein
MDGYGTNARVHNLEVTLHAMWALIQDTMPPAVVDDANKLMTEHYIASQKYGAFKEAGLKY